MNNNQSIRIRHATNSDAAVLADLGARTFAQTFAVYNTPEDMAEYLAKSFSPSIQAEELATLGCTFLILETLTEDQSWLPVGFVRMQAGPAPDCISGANPIELVRIYVLQECIGKGEGSRLMQASIDEARSSEHDVLWLGVWEKNERAIPFYQKWGFETVGTHEFILGSDHQTDYLMQRQV
jgi:ribosomal protein S18 acetylase RimI-like enzyme